MGIDEAHVHTEQGHEVFLRQHLVGRAFREDMPLEADDVRGVVKTMPRSWLTISCVNPLAARSSSSSSQNRCSP